MQNLLYILVPRNVKVSICSKKLCLNEKPTDIEVEIGGNELLRYMRKNTNFNFEVFYIENCKIEGKKIIASRKNEHMLPSVLVCSKENISTEEHNSYFLNRANNMDCCLFMPSGNKIDFWIGRTPVTFNTYLAKIGRIF